MGRKLDLFVLVVGIVLFVPYYLIPSILENSWPTLSCYYQKIKQKVI